jgi:plasmid maintenance system antidote protein VapI
MLNDNQIMRELLKEYLADNATTCNKVAQGAGIFRQTLNDFVKRNRNLTWKTLNKIQNYLEQHGK